MLLEVETKARIDNVALLRKIIKSIAIHEKTESRGDDYFAFNPKGYPKKAFRIRYDGKKYTVNFKKHLKKLWKEGVVVKEEYEFEILNRDQMRNFLALLEDLSFEPWVKKRKHTESYLYKKDKRVVIEINHVKNVGTYLEIEYLAKRSEVSKARNKILEVLNELGIQEDQIDNVGYTKRLYDKGIKGKKYFITNKFKK
ncbi:class IV adenylate cyclase [Patescibacteria group bacterium]|nr:class IV adenylate cyclase [Patescibacteria group bacterium]